MVPRPTDVPNCIYKTPPHLQYENYAFILVTPSVSYSWYTTLSFVGIPLGIADILAQSLQLSLRRLHINKSKNW